VAGKIDRALNPFAGGALLTAGEWRVGRKRRQAVLPRVRLRWWYGLAGGSPRRDRPVGSSVRALRICVGGRVYRACLPHAVLVCRAVEAGRFVRFSG
jgi:hypothetical protein